MHVLVTTAAWLRTAVNLFTYLCVFTAHICWQNALNRACLCVCVGGVWESELLSKPAFGGVFYSMLISFYFCIRVPVFLSLIKAAGNLWRLPVLRSNHVVSIVFPLYTPLWRVGTSYSFLYWSFPFFQFIQLSFDCLSTRTHTHYCTEGLVKFYFTTANWQV